MSREAMQMALEALIWTTGSDDFGDGGKAREGALKLLFPSIAALRERLAQPEREWVGLTDEQVEDEWERITGHSIFGGARSEGRAMYISPDEVIEFSRAIEAKLKEKNA